MGNSILRIVRSLDDPDGDVVSNLNVSNELGCDPDVINCGGYPPANSVSLLLPSSRSSSSWAGKDVMWDVSTLSLDQNSRTNERTWVGISPKFANNCDGLPAELEGRCCCVSVVDEKTFRRSEKGKEVRPKLRWTACQQ